jgi:hypothetical protein
VREIWGVTWTQAGTVWVGPAITDPEDRRLALAVACQRIMRQDGRDVRVDTGITLDRFKWDTDDAEGMTLTQPNGTGIPLEDTEAGEEP